MIFIVLLLLACEWLAFLIALMLAHAWGLGIPATAGVVLAAEFFYTLCMSWVRKEGPDQ